MIVVYENLAANACARVRRGGTLGTAKVDGSLAFEAEVILKRSNWIDPAKRRQAYSEQGWTKFDDTAAPYGPAQIGQERDRYRRRAI